MTEVRRRRANGSVLMRFRARVLSPRGRAVFDKTFTTRSDATRALKQAAALATLGQPVADDRRSVVALLDEYEATVKGYRRHRSYLATERLLRLWIRPYFEHHTLEQMNSAAELRRYVVWLRDARSHRTGRPLALGTVRSIVELVSSFLETNVAEGRLRSNQARNHAVGRRRLREQRRVNLPGGERGWLSIDDARRYQAAAWDLPYGDLCVFLLHSCMRNGEARGLLRSQLLLDAATPRIEVRTQIVHADPAKDAPPIGTRRNPGYTGAGRASVLSRELKTAASYRDLVCTEVMEVVLRQRLAALPALQLRAERWDSRYDLVFTSALGGPVPYTTLRVAHARICAAAGVRPITLHGLRHTGLSLLLAQDVPLREVMRIAGHSTLRELEQIYAYVVAEREARGAAAMSALLPLVGPAPARGSAIS